MELEVEHVSGIAVISVTEGLLGDESDELFTGVKRCLEEGNRKFIVDLSETGKIDSGGSGNVVRAFAEVKEREGTLVAVMPSSFFERPPFFHGPLDTIIEHFRSREEAVEALLDPTQSPDLTESKGSGCSTSASVVFLIGSLVLIATWLL